jgi:hypothetical protein
MATAPASRRLNLTRDQLAAFLTDQQQIRQFELLFSTVDTLQVIVGTDFEYQADNAAAAANNALAQISALAQDTAVDDAVLNAKVQQALDQVSLLAQDAAVNDAVLNAKAQQALDTLIQLAQDTAVNDAVLTAKVQQALDEVERIAQEITLVSVAPALIIGVSGSFTTADIPPKTISVVNGIITNIV